MILNQVEYIHFDPCPVFIFCRALNTYRVTESVRTGSGLVLSTLITAFFIALFPLVLKKLPTRPDGGVGQKIMTVPCSSYQHAYAGTLSGQHER